MNESERRAAMLAVPILSGFLGVLLDDVDTSARDSGESGSDDTIWSCPDSTFNAAADICRRFLAAEGVYDWLADILGPHWGLPSHAGGELAGSDLYLTIAGHGAGFLDGDYGPHGDALTEAAEEALKASWVALNTGEQADWLKNRPADVFQLEAYAGDDGHVYICGRE